MTGRIVTRDRLERLFIVGGTVTMGDLLQEHAGAPGLAGAVAVVLAGAISGTLLWLLRPTLASLPGERVLRLAAGPAGALSGLFGLPWRGSRSPSSDVPESAGTAPVSGRE